METGNEEPVEDAMETEVGKEELFSEEIRKSQAMLFSSLLRGQLAVESLETHKDILDLPVMYESCIEHWIDYRKDHFSEQEFVECRATFVQNGTCSCCHSVKRMCCFYLVDLASVTADFLPVLVTMAKLGCDLDGVERKDKQFVPLLLSIYHENLEAAKFLVSHNVDVNIASLSGELRPLWCCIMRQMTDFVELLLSAPGIDVNIQSSRGYPLLHFCLRNHSKYFEMLLQAGANPDISDSHLSTGLMISVSHHNEEAVQTLLRYGANMNQKNRRNEVPLVVAIYYGNARIAEVLLDAGADPDIIGDREADSPLLLACFDGNIDIIRLLIKYKANVGKPNHLGYTPLHIAAWNGHIECVREILKAGALHDLQTSDLNTPLALAAHGQHLAIVKELLPLGCNVNSADKDLDTPIHYAAYNGMTRTVELLLQYGANPNSCNRVNATPLWNAVYSGHKETVKLLLKENVVMEKASRGIDQHHQSEDVKLIYDLPRSPLWVAVDRGHTAIALLLVTAGYDLHKEDWLLKSRFPAPSHSDQLYSILTRNCQNPSKLISLCRTFIRQQLGLGILEKAKSLDIPVMLRDFLTFAELKYTVNESLEENPDLDSSY